MIWPVRSEIFVLCNKKGTGMRPVPRGDASINTEKGRGERIQRKEKGTGSDWLKRREGGSQSTVSNGQFIRDVDHSLPYRERSAKCWLFESESVVLPANHESQELRLGVIDWSDEVGVRCRALKVFDECLHRIEISSAAKEQVGEIYQQVFQRQIL